MSQDIILQLTMLALTAAAVYGAIRMDIKNIHEKIARNQSEIDKAHERIDGILIAKGRESVRAR